MPVRYEDLRSLVQSGGVFTAADLLEKLSDVLTVSQKQELVSVLAVATKGAIRPGDLITATLINDVVKQIAAIEERLAFVEQSLGKDGAVVITGFIPESASVKVGETLSIKGRNFEYSKGLARAYIDRYPVLGFLSGSDDDLLILKVPEEITDVPVEGRPALLMINNNVSTAQAMIFLQPSVALAGFFELNEVDTRPVAATPAGGQSLTLEYEVVSRANLDTTVTLQAVISGPTNASDWQLNTDILNGNETTIPGHKLPLSMSERKRFLVRINPIPVGTPSGTAFTVEAQVSAGAIVKKQGVAFTVGQPYAAPDNTITINYASGEIRPPGASGSVSATGVQIAAGAGAKVVFVATFEQAGAYDLTLTAPTNWGSQLIEGTQTPVTVATNEVAGGGKASKLIVCTVWPNTGAAASGMFSVRLQKQGAAKSRSTSMNAQLKTV